MVSSVENRLSEWVCLVGNCLTAHWVDKWENCLNISGLCFTLIEFHDFASSVFLDNYLGQSKNYTRMCMQILIKQRNGIRAKINKLQVVFAWEGFIE